MAEFKRLPTQEELSRMLYQMQLGEKSQQDIINENLSSGSTIKAIPDNVFQKMAKGAGIAKEQVNKLGNAADLAKMFPGYTGESQVRIPTGFNFAPKQTATGEVIPQGLQTQQVNVDQLLKAIKPSDVLGLTGAQQAYTDVGMGKAPSPMDVLDVAGLGAVGMGAGKGLLGAAKATKGLPVGMGIKDVSKPTKKLEIGIKADDGSKEIDKIFNKFSTKADALNLNTISGSSNVSGSRYLTFKNPDGIDYQIRISNHADRYPGNIDGERLSIDPSTEITYSDAINWLKNKGIDLNKRAKKQKEIMYSEMKKSEHEFKSEYINGAWVKVPGKYVPMNGKMIFKPD